MRVPKNLGAFAAALACLNLVMPLQMVQAAGQSGTTGTTATQATSTSPRVAPRPVTRDLKLGPTRELRGQLVDKNGVRLAKRIVVAVHADKTSMETVTDANGRFRFPQAKPGTYQVASQQSYQVCRCWVANTAPPVAAEQLLLVEGDLTLRGQRPIGELLSGPVLIGLIIAAAIIIPIAVHNSQKSAS